VGNFFVVIKDFYRHCFTIGNEIAGHVYRRGSKLGPTCIYGGIWRSPFLRNADLCSQG